MLTSRYPVRYLSDCRQWVVIDTLRGHCTLATFATRAQAAAFALARKIRDQYS